MEKWGKIRLGDACVTNVDSYSQKDAWDYVNYLDTGNITDNIIDFIQYIDLKHEKLPSRARRKVKKNSIIYSTVRPNQRHFGIIKVQAENFLVSTGFTVIDVYEEILDADFLFYMLSQNTLVENLQAIAEQSTSAYPSIKSSDIENLEIMIPDLAAQKKISNILKSIDEKITQNTEINRNLLQQATLIFEHYYNKAVDRIPFTSVIKVFGGGTPKTKNPEFWDGGIPFFTPKDVGTPYVFSTEKTITELGLNHCNSPLYETNTTFVTARGTVGKVSIAGKPMAMNQSCYALVSDVLDPLLVYFYTLMVVDSLKHKASGAVFDAIVTRDFNAEIISRISADDEAIVTSTLRPMMMRVHSNIIENRELAQMRDTLLSRLMSGELDVSNLDL